MIIVCMFLSHFLEEVTSCFHKIRFGTKTVKIQWSGSGILAVILHLGLVLWGGGYGVLNKSKLMYVQHIRLIKLISPVQVIRELSLPKTPMNTLIITHRQSHVRVKIIFNPGMRQKEGLQYLLVTSTSKMSLIQRYWTS